MGANLGNKEATLQRALELLDREKGVRVDAASGVYLTEPVGLKDQPWFANRAARLMVDPDEHDARSLLDRLLQVELHLGRVRGERWGPRAIDLDLLLFGAQTVDEQELKVPHPRMAERAFVLAPLLEIAPDLRLPDGRSAADCLKAIPHAVHKRRILQET